ncbi:hypothetical protein FA95DRAFT_1561322 [Auriscalpium vulgare]|uniref:Uncharacterized protein n=1 Tax=Auriscalpium vulgare TaxID=40419 RepID=A0ACB8RM88_9AGAM|nr:hypothetical protein FA95DRAFT_1561322 [Auriscalpium vulgare]
MAPYYNFRSTPARQARQQQALRDERIRKHVEAFGPQNASRINASISSNGEGVHLRFNSLSPEDVVPAFDHRNYLPPSDDAPDSSPTSSRASSPQPKSIASSDDEDSEMDDSSSSSSSSTSSPSSEDDEMDSSSDAESTASGSTERPHTPQPTARYDPGSVVRTPRKLQASPDRIGGHGFPIWRQNAPGSRSPSVVVEEHRVVYPADYVPKADLQDIEATRRRVAERRAAEVPRIRDEQLKKMQRREFFFRGRRMQAATEEEGMEMEYLEDDMIEEEERPSSPLSGAGFSGSSSDTEGDYVMERSASEALVEDVLSDPRFLGSDDLQNLIGWRPPREEAQEELSNPSLQTVAGPSRQPASGSPTEEMVTVTRRVRALGPQGTFVLHPDTHQELFIEKTLEVPARLLHDYDDLLMYSDCC